MGKLTLTQKITIGAVLISAILAVIGNIFVREWYQPFIKYSESAFYFSGDSAITSLHIENLGHGDAKDLVITVIFDSKILNISTDRPINLISTNIKDGGDKSAMLLIDRIVPKQDISIFFAVVDNSINRSKIDKKYVTELTFDGGMGTTKDPKLLNVLLIMILIIIYLGTIIGTRIFAKYKSKQRQEIWEENLPDIVSYVYESYESGINEEQLKRELVDFLDENTKLKTEQKLRALPVGLTLFSFLKYLESKAEEETPT